MDKFIIAMLMEGYDLLFNNFRGISGLLDPKAQDYVEIILQKRLPGMARKGGAAFKKASVRWDVLQDPVELEKILLDMKTYVDKVLITEKHKMKS
jgi:hypothetical protein